MKKYNLSYCKCCGKVKKYGRFEPIDLMSMEAIQMNREVINLIDENCPDCATTGYYSQAIA